MKLLKKLSLLVFTVSCLLPTLAAAGSKPKVLLNQDIGFAVKGYKYDQESFPCNIETMLVERIVKDGKRSDIDIEPVSLANLPPSDSPILAIDIQRMSLGSKEHAYGVKNKRVSRLPSIGVQVALVSGQGSDATVLTAKHSCAFVNFNQLNPTITSVLEIGAPGLSICDVTRKCLIELSDDIVDWLEPQL